MRRIRISALCVVFLVSFLAVPVAAQTHPCDQTVQTVEVRPSVPFAVGFCSDFKDAEGNPVQIDTFKIAIDAGTPQVFQRAQMTVSATTSATGQYYLETPKILTVAKGSHTLTIVASNADGGDGPATVPFPFTARMLPPGQVGKPRIVK